MLFKNQKTALTANVHFENIAETNLILEILALNKIFIHIK